MHVCTLSCACVCVYIHVHMDYGRHFGSLEGGLHICMSVYSLVCVCVYIYMYTCIMSDILALWREHLVYAHSAVCVCVCIYTCVHMHILSTPVYTLQYIRIYSTVYLYSPSEGGLCIWGRTEYTHTHTAECVRSAVCVCMCVYTGVHMHFRRHLSSMKGRLSILLCVHSLMCVCVCPYIHVFICTLGDIVPV